MSHGNVFKPIFLVALVLCFASLMHSQTPNAKQPAKEKIRIGWSIGNMNLERWQADSEAFQGRAKALGAEVIVKDAEGDTKRLVSQTKELLSSGIQVLVIIGADPTSETEIVSAAKARNVRVISYEGSVAGSEDLYIVTDFSQIGRSQAATLTDLAPAGNYAILAGPASESKGFHDPQLEVLQPFLKDGRIKLAADIAAKDWSASEAYVNMTRVLEANHDNITAVIATNDSIASGAIQALEEHGLAGKVLVSGQDADLSAIVRVLMGTQTMTVYKPFAPQARVAAEAAVSLAKGEPVKTNGEYKADKMNVPTIYFAPVVVTKNNVKETVIKDGFQTIEEIKRGLPQDKWALIE